MIRFITTAVLLAALMVPSAALAAEEGATFDGGICQEADGTAGFATPDGECITPADYAEMFSYEALAATSSLAVEGSVADAYGITAESAPADERQLGEGLVETTRTFGELVLIAHGIYAN